MDSFCFSVKDVLPRGSKYFSNKTAIVFEDTRVTYGELNKRVNRLSNAFLSLGVKKEGHIALLFRNTSEFVESHFAVTKAGGISVPLNFRLTGQELAQMIDNSDSAVLIYDAEFSEVVTSIRHKLPQVKHYICSGETIQGGMINYEELINKSSSIEPDVNVEMDDGYAICYTGGTTGLPKGAYRTHSNALWNAVASIIGLRLRHDDMVLGTTPLFHAAGWESVALPALWLGSTVVLVRGFDPKQVLETIQKERITVIFLIATMSLVLWNLPDISKYDLSSLRIYGSGSGRLPLDLKKRIISHLPNVEIIDSYGLTEAGGGTFLPPESVIRKDNPFGISLGIPALDQKVRVVDDNGNEVPQGEVGELLLQGPQVVKKYYKGPERTKELIRSGWFHTGDLVREDEEGYLFLVDRKKDMIKSGGENVYAAEVEAVIYSHPKVSEVAVIGLPDERWSERVTAVVVLKPYESLSDRELIGFCRNKGLSSYKCPKEVKFLDEPLPKSSVGKILKRELRGRFVNHPFKNG